MNKTNFYENVISHFCKHDIEDMMTYHGAKNYECMIGDNVIDKIDDVINDFNGFFEKTNIDYTINKTDTINLIKDALKPHYSGKMMICISYEDLYDHLIDKKILSAENEISIYRIESKDYKGFYNHFEELGRPLSDRFDFESSEVPGCDGVLSLQYMNTEYREKGQKNIFGFETKEMLGKWLTNTEGLAEEIVVEKLFISEYKVKEKDVLITKNQVAFSKDNSRVVKRLPIGEFLKGRLEKAKHETNPDKDSKDILSFLKSKDGDVIVTKKKKRKSKKDGFKNDKQLPLF